jgi:hypothetical protein
MSKLLQCKIDVTKIDKNLLFKGEKGTYLNCNIWINDAPDKYNNDCSIEQQTPKGEKKVYIGNGKFYKPEPVKTEDRDSEDNELKDLPF